MSAYYNENDEGAAEWLRELIKAGEIPDGEIDTRSIRDVCPVDLRGFAECHFFAGVGIWARALRNTGGPGDDVVWTGSCPCQPFSGAGTGGGVDDERHLWPDWLWHIRQHRPNRIYGEQVASKDGLSWLDLVCSDLEGEGYAAGPSDTCSAGFGAPHRRQRIYFVADMLGEGSQGLRGDVAHRNEPGWFDADPARSAAPGSRAGIMGNAYGGDASAEGLQRGREHGLQPGDRQTKFLVNAKGIGGGTGLPDRQQAGDRRYEPSDAGRNEPPGPVNGFWRDADWISCTDKKWRAVEPGSFPLANGIAGRMGLLRGYGNAINLEQATAFIEESKIAIRQWRSAS